MNFRANLGPTPLAGQIQARENPCLDLLPCVLGKEWTDAAKLHFNLVEPLTTPCFTIAIDA